MTYQDNLNACKKSYPFEFWGEFHAEGGAYSPEICEMMENIFDTLISALINLGKDAEPSEKVKLFKLTVERLNVISKTQPELIETMEREAYCDLFDEIAVACGIDIRQYDDGIASEWREW